MLTDALPIRHVVPPVSLAAAQARAESLPIRTSFERFEVKYWVSSRMAERVLQFVHPYLQRDPMSHADRTAQRNTSLYLDTPSFLFWHLHINSAPSRYKLRVRAYGEPPSGNAFFEVKQKVKSVTLKVRATAPLSSLEDVLRGRLNRVRCDPKHRKNLETFLCLLTTHRAEPKILISCCREPFVSRNPGEDVRMTLDRDIVYQPALRAELRADPKAWQSVRDLEKAPPGLGEHPVLIELKFRGAAPVWMAELVQRYELRRESFSKYTTAVALLRSRPALSR